MPTNVDNYIYKLKDFHIGDTIVCVFQYRESKGFIKRISSGQTTQIDLIMDVRKHEFTIPNSPKPKKEVLKYQVFTIIEQNIFSFRMAHTKVVLLEKINPLF